MDLKDLSKVGWKTSTLTRNLGTGSEQLLQVSLSGLPGNERLTCFGSGQDPLTTGCDLKLAR